MRQAFSSFLTTTALSIALMATQAQAGLDGEPDAFEGFDGAAAVSDQELDEMRGGFITAGGLQISFGLQTQTIINNTVVSELQISSDTAAALRPEDLINVVQNGPANSSLDFASLAELPGVVNVVQNTLDNQVIQNLNILDVDVNGVAKFSQQAQTTPILNFQAIAALQ